MEEERRGRREKEGRGGRFQHLLLEEAGEVEVVGHGDQLERVDEARRPGFRRLCGFTLQS